MKPTKHAFKTLKVQMALYFFIASVLSIALIGMIAYYSTFNIVLGDQLKHTKASVEQSGKYLEVYLDKLKAQADVIANDYDTIAYFSGGSESAKEQVMQLIDHTLETDDALVSVIIVGKNGVILSNEKGLDMALSEDMMKEPWYVAAINSDMPVLTAARQQSFTMDKDTWVISRSQELKNSNGQNIGVLLIDIRYEVMASYLTDLNLGKDGFAFIVDDDRNLVYHPDVSYFENEEKKASLAYFCDRLVGYDKAMGLLTHKYQIKGSNWLLIGISSLDELDMIRRQMLEILVLAGLILSAIAVGAGWFMAERISKPIRKLEMAMLEVESVMTQIEVEGKACYEVVSLTDHYNKMIETIRGLMSEIKENEGYLRSYEINALHSQINPHFLYNTLDTIVWMAEFNDSEKVIAVTKSLAQFFRLSLSKGQEMISLKDEFNHVGQYLFIQKQRYDDQLNYKITSDEDLEALGIDNVKVPKIILQPLVENALYHGIREKSTPGHIEVRVEYNASEATLRIIIEDDGVGFDVHRGSTSKVKLGGIGLNNVDQRLKLYYGDGYGLTVTSEIERGTKVVILLPMD